MDGPASLLGKINLAMRINAGVTGLAKIKALFGEYPITLKVKPTKKVITRA